MISTAWLLPSEASAFRANKARNRTARGTFPDRFRRAFESAGSDDGRSTVMVDVQQQNFSGRKIYTRRASQNHNFRISASCNCQRSSRAQLPCRPLPLLFTESLNDFLHHCQPRELSATSTQLPAWLVLRSISPRSCISSLRACRWCLTM
jgi:hypothetical protein